MSTQLQVALVVGAGVVGLGLLLGESGFGVRFDDAALTSDLGLLALAVILAEGGLTTRLSAVRPFLGLSVALGTAGVLVSIAADAYCLRELSNLRFGIGQARRGWLEKNDVLNSRPLAALRPLLARTMQ